MYLVPIAPPRPTFRPGRRIPAAPWLFPIAAIASAGPPDEGVWARALRWIADRSRLAELDDRILRDIGLTPGDVARGTVFGRGRGHGA